MTRILLHGVLCTLFLSVAPVAGAPRSADETRRYDIRELLIAVPDFEGGFQQERPEGSPPVAPKAPSRPEVVEHLFGTLRLALSAERVQMHEESGSLVVTGSAEAHESVASLIAEMKRQQAAQINVECRFLVLTREALGKLTPEMRATLALATRSPRALAQAELDQLHELIRQNEAAQSLSAPNLTLFGQQKAHVTVSSDQFYVADQERIEGGGWQPKIGLAEHGLKVTVRAAVSPDGTQASAEVSWWLQRILDIETVEVAPNVQKQQPHLETREGARLVSGPAGTTFVVGVAEVSPPEDAPKDSPSELLLVLVRLNPTAGVPDPEGELPQLP